MAINGAALRHVWAAAACLVVFAAPAAAQSERELHARCDNLGGRFTPDVAIAGCTALILSGRLAGADLAAIFYNRGLAYHGRRDYLRAIADYDVAIRLDPRDAQAHYNRGLARFHQRDYPRAIADFSEAIRLSPLFADAYHNRGLAHQALGENTRADTDLGEAARLRQAAAPPLPATIPNPVLSFQGRERYKANGRDWMRYRYDVSNRASFPAELFAPAPRLPPCGANANASRTWVDVYDQNGRRLYGFCALSGPEQLGSIWFPLEAGARPPRNIYIEMTDRLTGRRYRSNLAGTGR